MVGRLAWGGIVSRIFVAAVLGGLIAGAFYAVINHVFVVPLLLEAETYEVAEPVAGGTDGHAHDHGGEAAGSAHHDEEAWAPEDGSERTTYTVITSFVTAVGFALLLSAAYALRRRVTWQQGILWGLAGFIAVNLAPALGIPPKLPGEAVGDIGDRQVWWIATAILTAGGIAVLTLVRRYWNFAGLVLVAIPHIWGAPTGGNGEGGLVPDDLAETFVATSLSTNAVFWIVLGVATAFVFERFARGARTREPVNGA